MCVRVARLRRGGGGRGVVRFGDCVCVAVSVAVLAAMLVETVAKHGPATRRADDTVAISKDDVLCAVNGTDVSSVAPELMG